MKNILIITTGGTVSCEGGENGLSPNHSGSFLIKGINGCRLTVKDLFACDSTDISAAHLKKLYAAVKSAEGYDGIVILHGTDTLAYTAAMLYYTVSDLNIPIIITGSMLPFTAPDSDGKKNISDSVAAACDERLCGVYVVFCGRIIGGGETIKRNSIEKDAFRSFGGKDCGKISDGKIALYHKSCPDIMGMPPSYEKKIAVIKLSVFTEEISVPKGYSGAVIESFGAGGIPMRERLIESVGKLIKRMPVIITTDCTCGANLYEYEVGQRALALGVTDGRNMTTMNAAVRLWLET